MINRVAKACREELKRQAKEGRRTFSTEGGKVFFDGYFDSHALARAALSAAGVMPSIGLVANDSRADARSLADSLVEVRDQIDALLESGRLQAVGEEVRVNDKLRSRG